MEAFNDIKVKIVTEEGNEGLYEIGPLPKGYGHTLGNALRRILYSSLEGAGVTSVKIKGIQHEYSTIKGVKEDVLSILLNLKEVKFKVDSDEPQICKLSAKGKKTIKASDIETTGVVEITTPDIEIANISDDSGSIEMEIVVEKGMGYLDNQDAERKESGRIPLDADFSPIKKVSMLVERARKGQETDLDAVIIGVETDGSIAPKQALLDSAKILQEFSGKVMIALGVSKKEVEEREEEVNKIEEVEEEKADESDEIGNWKVEDLPISKRSKTGLLSGGFKTLKDLREVKSSQLLALPGFGNKSLNEVIDLLSQYGIEIINE
jgi:DNA-directed RNA polymerase subunit alpha